MWCHQELTAAAYDKHKGVAPPWPRPAQVPPSSFPSTPRPPPSPCWPSPGYLCGSPRGSRGAASAGCGRHAPPPRRWGPCRRRQTVQTPLRRRHGAESSGARLGGRAGGEPWTAGGAGRPQRRLSVHRANCLLSLSTGWLDTGHRDAGTWEGSGWHSPHRSRWYCGLHEQPG